MPENRFTGWVATEYEARWPETFAPEVVEPAVAFLAEEARMGAALELGIGTGRLALPLSRRGVRVHGIDLSPDMVAELRAKPSGDAIGVTLGDFATVGVPELVGTCTLVFLVRNTIMNLTTQDEQVACFANAAAHLEPGGCFVLEVMVPELRRLPPGETVRAFTVTPTHLGFEEYTDYVAQESWSHHYWVIDGELHNFSAPFRYVWPAELDLMAQLAGLRLRDRWSDWHRGPFTNESRSHVSVWVKET
jgi:SAM-dependent methyltransferase